MTPAPTVRHQLVVDEVLRFLLDFTMHRRGYAVASPVDVFLAEHSIVQPDVLYVSPVRLRLQEGAVYRSPAIVDLKIDLGPARSTLDSGNDRPSETCRRQVLLERACYRLTVGMTVGDDRIHRSTVQFPDLAVIEAALVARQTPVVAAAAH